MRTASILILLFAIGAPGLHAQAAADSVPAADAASAVDPALAVPVGGLPVSLRVGLAWGVRTDPCVACADPQNLSSFSGHLGISKPISGGLGIGLEASVWQRGHPNPLAVATPGEGEGEGEAEAPAGAAADTIPALVNRLANLSVAFSYQVRYLYLRAGVGAALGWSDVAEDDGEGNITVARASGAGVGYTVGGGLVLPLAGPVGIAFFANWNAGSYDLNSTSAVVARGARHEYLEMGVGLSVR